MTTYSFSASQMAFYPNALRGSLYEPAGAWPEDALEVADDIAAEFMTVTPPAGKVLGAEEYLPVWVDAPQPTDEELAAMALEKMKLLRAQADSVIAPLKDALDGGYIDESDKDKLTAWQKYRYDLSKVALTKPVWPDKPAV